MTEWILTSSALILVVIGLRGLLKNNLRPMIRYGLWALVLLRLLIPFSLFESTLSIGNAVQSFDRQTSAATQQYENTYDRVVDQHTQMGVSLTPAQTREEVQQQIFSDSYAEISDRYAQQGMQVPDQVIRLEAQTQTQSIRITALISGILPTIWYAGMALMALVFLSSNARFARKLHLSRVSLSRPGYPLPVFEATGTATPCLFGLIRPAVYLTPEVAGDPTMIRHVLTHELTHFRHSDHIWSVLRSICLVIHWYNPLVWAAAILSRQDGELACDEATIHALGEEERIPYGKTLVGMTCIKRDPKSFLITSTTMIGRKETLKERITAIARKPKNAILAVVSCVLILAITAGCTFSGALTGHSEPTEPTTAMDALYEQVKAAAQAINSRETLHFRYYIRPNLPASVEELTAQTDYTEGWICGENLYEERHEQDKTIPQRLHYNGSIYNHLRDNLWLTADSSNLDTADYRVSLPNRSDCTMFWIETSGYLDVTFADNSSNHGSGTEIRLDADGKLVWYATYIHTTGSADAQGEGASLYLILTYEDTDPRQIRTHLDTVAPELIADMEIFDFREFDQPKIADDGYLYTASGRQISAEPVTAYAQSYNAIFYLTESGKLIQASITDDFSQKELYEVSAGTSPLACSYPNLYFIDGTDLIVLDVTTGNAAVAGSFEHCEYIQPVANTWLWVNIRTQDYAYDTATGKLAPLLTEDALDRFLAGEWPDATSDLPEDYTLSDVVTASEEEISWKCELGHDHTLSVSLPQIAPYSEAAIRLQDRINRDWQILIEEDCNAQNTATCPLLLYTDFEASLTQNLLSITIHARWDYDYDSYKVYNMDTVTGQQLRPADMARRYLGVSYPEFLQAVYQFRLRSPETNPVTYLIPEILALDQTALYVDPEGRLMLRYDALVLAGADFYPTVIPCPAELEFVGVEAAYAWLFGLYDPDEWDSDEALEYYWTIIQDTYAADIDVFEEQLSKADAATQDNIWHIVSNPCPTPYE